MHPFNELRKYTDMRDIVLEGLEDSEADPETIYMCYEFLDELEEMREGLISILIIKD